MLHEGFGEVGWRTSCKPYIIFMDFSRFPLLTDSGKQRFFCFPDDTASEPLMCTCCKRETSTEPEGFLWMWKESGRQSLSLRSNINGQGHVTCIAQKWVMEKKAGLLSMVRHVSCLKSSKFETVKIRSCSCKVPDLEKELPLKDFGLAPLKVWNERAI